MSNAAVLEKSPQIHNEIRPRGIHPEGQLPVCVVFTSVNGTRKAMEKASQLARFFKCGIEVVAVYSVPYALPLDEPPAPFEVLVGQLEEMADGFPKHTQVSAYLCRDALETLKQILDVNCPVVMSVQKHWWPSHDERLARKLRRAGYSVILVNQE